LPTRKYFTTARTIRAMRLVFPATETAVIHRVLAAGLFAGLLAGLAIAFLQQFTTSPLILKGEVYEAAAAAPAAAVHDHDAHAHSNPAAHEHGEEEGWKPREGFERIAVTSLATVAASIGYTLLLLAAMLLGGFEITTYRALTFAACGFIATALAPSMGLAPELPGSAAGPLIERQVWWIATAAATAGSLWLLLSSKLPGAKPAGLILLALPHIIGAPKPPAFESTAPAELAGQFAAASLGLQALLWASIGFAVAAVWPLFQPGGAANRKLMERAAP
jgi:cobalt transporter subunit CbtA